MKSPAASITSPSAASSLPVSPEFPRYSIALVQSESEMLHGPARDLSAHLDSDPRWSCRLFTERTFPALMQTADQYHCIVIGHNAVHKSLQIRAALAAGTPRTNMLVLQQLRQQGMEFLGPSRAVQVVSLDPGTAEAKVAAHVSLSEEVLLNWPERISDEISQTKGIEARAVCALRVTPNSDWREILAVDSGGERLALVVRTAAVTERPATVLCSLMLDHRVPLQRALLANMIMFCAAGVPDTVIVDEPGSASGAALTRKLYMLGAHAVSLQARSASELDFERWPLRGVSSVVMLPRWKLTEPAKTWLGDGGRMVDIVDASGVQVLHGGSDEHWIARQWALHLESRDRSAWLGRRGEGAVEGSIMETRAVLRVLRLLEREGVDPDRLGLPKLTDGLLHKQARLLLDSRIRSDGADGTTSTTIAALDIDDLLGRKVLDHGVRGRLERSLRDAYPTAPAEDKLAIARCAPGVAPFDEVVAAMPETLSAVAVTRLREAAVACCEAEPDPMGLTSDRFVVEPEIDTSVLLAANYLSALVAVRGRWPDSVLSRVEQATVDRALLTIARHGQLLRDFDDSAVSMEMLSAEAMALIAYLGRSGRLTADDTAAPVHILRAEARGSRPYLVDGLLRETRRLRDENARVNSLKSVLRRARIVCTALMLLAALMLAIFLHPGLDNASDWAAWGAFVLVAAGVALALLESFGLLAPWGRAVTQAMVGGWKGMGSALQKAAGRPR